LRLTKFIIACLVLSFTLPWAGCRKQSTVTYIDRRKGRRELINPIEVAKIKVTRAGEIYLQGKLVTFEELEKELANLRQMKGAVWYYSEDSSQPVSDAVKGAIIKARLPMKSTKEPFE
jgi:biopolymer transport protein ExbD